MKYSKESKLDRINKLKQIRNNKRDNKIAERRLCIL